MSDTIKPSELTGGYAKIGAKIRPIIANADRIRTPIHFVLDYSRYATTREFEPQYPGDPDVEFTLDYALLAADLDACGWPEELIEVIAGLVPENDKEEDAEIEAMFVAHITQNPQNVRIPVAELDPDTLVGIAPCDDGSEGWVVMGVQPDPDEPDKEIVAPIGDEHGQIVYLDINDAAEVLRTGKVWKHDMGDGEPTQDPDSGPLTPS